MINKKLYKILAVITFAFHTIGTIFLETVTVIGGLIIAVYFTLWAILSHLEEVKEKNQ